MNPAELSLIKARIQKATQGPWQAYVEGREHLSGSHFIMTGENEDRGVDIEIFGATIDDLEFIAHARQDIPKLVDEIVRLNEIIEGYQNQSQ